MGDGTEVMRSGVEQARYGPGAMAIVGGVLLAAFPLLRPWGDKSGDAALIIDAFASPMWVVAHVAGMVGFLLIAGAALAWRSGGARWWLAGGVALVLPFFGAETFGLHAIAGEVVRGGSSGADGMTDAAAVLMADGIREGAAQMTMFGAGLFAIAVGGVMLARRDRTAIPMAIALVTYLPQFFFGPEVRIAHGLFLLVGAAWWAWSLVKAGGGAGVADGEEGEDEGGNRDTAINGRAGALQKKTAATAAG